MCLWLELPFFVILLGGCLAVFNYDFFRCLVLLFVLGSVLFLEEPMSDYKKDIHSFKTEDITNEIELTWLSLGSVQQHWTGLQNHGGATIDAQLEEECFWGHERLDTENWIRVLFPHAGRFKHSLLRLDVTLTWFFCSWPNPRPILLPQRSSHAPSTWPRASSWPTTWSTRSSRSSTRTATTSSATRSSSASWRSGCTAATGWAQAPQGALEEERENAS